MNLPNYPQVIDITAEPFPDSSFSGFYNELHAYAVGTSATLSSVQCFVETQTSAENDFVNNLLILFSIRHPSFKNRFTLMCGALAALDALVSVKLLNCLFRNFSARKDFVVLERVINAPLTWRKLVLMDLPNAHEDDSWTLIDVRGNVPCRACFV